MAIEAFHVRFCYSKIRKDDVEVSRLYLNDGFLLLEEDADEWILSNPADCLSVISLELVYCKAVEKIDCVSKLHNLQRLFLRDCFELQELPANLGDLGSLTHLSLEGCWSIKSIPSSIGKLSNLTALHINGCRSLKELPANLGDLESLTHLSLEGCWSIKSIPSSIGKLSNLTALHLNNCISLQELPANLGELMPKLSLLNIQFTKIKWLPWSIAKLSKLSVLLLPSEFRLETLPVDLIYSVVISNKNTLRVRKTWRELKTQIVLLESIPIVGEIVAEAAQLPSTPGYVAYKGDPRPWIQKKGLYSLVRILDLNLMRYKCEETLSHSIVELPMLTHLYITGGCLFHLPVTLRKITHLSLRICKFKCDIEPLFDSLEKLSTLQSLEIRECEELPAHMDLPVSLTNLTLQSFWFIVLLPDSSVASIRKLSNLKSLVLLDYNDLDLSLLNLNLVKLKIWDSSIKSLPAGLRHLEIMHCRFDDELLLCLNNLVNLETLSVTCRKIQSLPSIEGLLSLQELHLKDCFRLRNFPPNVDKLVNLRSINVSGTRIKSLPDSITYLQNLRHLILPKCFEFESLSQNFKKKVMVSKDDTDDFYYERKGYYDSWYDSNEDSESTSGSIEEDDGGVLQESEHEINNEQASLDRPMNSIPNANQVHEENEDCVVPVAPDNHSNFHETYGHISQQVHADPNGLGGSHFSGRTDQIDNVVAVAPDNHSNFHEPYGHHIPNNISQVHADPNALGVSENIFQGVWSIPNQPMVMLPSTVANPNSNPHETTFDESNPHVFWNLLNHQPMVMLPSKATNPHETTFGESNEQACLNRLTDNNNLEMEWRNASFDSTNPVHDRSNEHALVNQQKKTQKIEIAKEHILELRAQGMRLVDAAEQLDVSRSTLKRKLKDYNITWETEKKRKQHQDSKSKKQNKNTPSGGNFLVLDSVDSANLVAHDHTVEHLDGMNQLTLSDHLPSESNAVLNSVPDAMRSIVEDPSLETQCHVHGHQQVEVPSLETQCHVSGCHEQVKEHSNNVKECALSNIVQAANESSSIFVVKATCNEDTVRFDFSTSYGIEQLKEEVSKRLELEAGNFKIKYLDEWMLMTTVSDLEHALRLSKSSGSSVVRLQVNLKS